MGEGRGKILANGETAVWLDRLLGHWLLTAAMILVAAALTIPQIDRVALGKDANMQYIQSHGFTGEPHTALDVLDLLTPTQQPLSHLLLHFWGYAAGHSVAAARMLFLYCGLLSLAAVYRLTRDAVAPIAGTLAVFVLLNLAIYAFFWAHVRYYSLVTLLAALALWLYLRVCSPTRRPRARDYLSLILACCALLFTHASGYKLAGAMALYHLAVVKKDRRWLQVASAGGVALVLISPLLIRALTEGIHKAWSTHGRDINSLTETLPTWLLTYSNGSPLLLLIVAAGAIVGWRRGLLRGNPFLPLLPMLLFSVAILTEATGVIGATKMRYLLVGAPIVAGFVASGLYAFYRMRRWLGLLALLWLAAGMHFHATADWERLALTRPSSYHRVPWHVVSRWMRNTNETLLALAFNVDHTSLVMRTERTTNVLLRHFFWQHGLDMQNRSALDIDGRIGDNRLERPGYWILFQHGVTKPETIDTVLATLDKHGYEACGAQAIPNNTEIFTYRWKSLQCDTQPKATFATNSGVYSHFGAVRDGASLLFVGQWRPADPTAVDSYNISVQLLDGDWNNHAQIDLPASSLVDMRQFAFNLAQVPHGEYRLMAIVYNAQTGERLAWQDNDGWIPEMRQLAEIQIPATVRETP